MKLVQGVCPC